ncbi:uncharacterized protein LOC133662166 [Entelurus aequoreus]|uniref:uncharacterized protein LOC133662166 n=1 Tax=Entelurus aequoreus TaxID=161455 RepID=UPI002B1D7B25|nr:uncharacterized protein LOC133662166 [Entelurus aequoreus]XP_061921889.1 uncharacterized protein LOC133662166 [Entelurus aequoreus]
MDFVQNSGVKVPNAVIASGVTGTKEQDDQVIDFLKKYGTIERSLYVDDDSSPFYNNLIVEYSNCEDVEILKAILPYSNRMIHGEHSVVYTVKTLGSVYTTEMGSDVTKTFLNDLKTIAKLSGKEYEEVPQEMMSQIGRDIGATSPVTEEDSTVHVETTFVTPQLLSTSEQSEQSPILSSNASQNNIGLNVADSAPISSERRAPLLLVSDLNPPEIQKVVVEHIVRREDVSSHLQSPVRLRSFSGKTPKPNNETDYDTWRSHVELLMKDPNMSPFQISRRILESLLSPAAEVVKGLRPDSPPLTYLELLDSAFGTVEEGEELFAQFLNTYQDPAEKSSTYLHRLQAALNLVVKREGVAPEEVDNHLLKQFCRGCFDFSLLSTLQLDQKKSSPPSFSALLLMVRTEEDRQQQKSIRMKKHFGATKQRAQLQSQGACAWAEPERKTEVSPNVIEELMRQVASLQSQLTTFMTQEKSKGSNKGAENKSQSKVPDNANADTQKQTREKQRGRPRPWYCFNCGEDGHISPSCTEAANPALVAKKKKQLKDKRRAWEAQNHPNSHLND